MSEFESKARGAAREAISVMKGHTGIFASLAREHGHLLSLLDQAIETSSETKRRALRDQIRLDLLSHTRAEEQTFYAELLGHAETRDLVEQSRDDHHKIWERLKQAFSEDGGPQQHRANLERLREVVEYHVTREENEIFPTAEEVIPSASGAQLAEHFAQIKEIEHNRLASDGAGWAQGPLVR